MLEKLELIWELSHLFSGVDVHLVSRNEAEIRTHLTQTLSRKLGADWSNLPIVTQICALDSTHIYEYTPFPGITLPEMLEVLKHGRHKLDRQSHAGRA